MKITLTAVWVRQTKQHHIYTVKFPNQSRASVLAVPKFGKMEGYSLPTSIPPKKLSITITEVENG